VTFRVKSPARTHEFDERRRHIDERYPGRDDLGWDDSFPYQHPGHVDGLFVQTRTVPETVARRLPLTERLAVVAGDHDQQTNHHTDCVSHPILLPNN